MIGLPRHVRPRPSRLTRFLGVTAGLAAILVLGSLGQAKSVAATGATFNPDNAASELTRLLNGERAAHGLPVIEVDPFLAWVARDGPVACPDGSGTMDGRAKDMAINNYFSHALRLCPGYDVGDAMRSWGYTSYLGEIVAMNGGYNFEPFPYQFGCDVTEANCTGESTTAPTTVAIASYQFMTSQGHRDIVLSTYYDRFACGAWQTSNGSFYACMFAFGPGNEVPPAPTPTPTPTPAPTPLPDVTAPTMTTLSAPGLVTSPSRAFTATFAGTDDVGVVAYEIRTKKGATGAWSTPAPQSVTSHTFSGLAPGTWYIDVRARDAVGNPSPWREAVVVIPTDDRTWSFSAGNTRRTGPSYIRSTATTTSMSGARMKIAFSGSSFSLIGTAGRYYGRLRVTIDGHSYLVDSGYYRGARAATNHHRVVLYSRSLAPGRHAVTITCLATPGRRTISIDAVGWRN